MSNDIFSLLAIGDTMDNMNLIGTCLITAHVSISTFWDDIRGEEI